MGVKSNELLYRLSKAISSDNFTDIAYDIVEEIEERQDSFDFVEPILRLMECNPNADFGNPGPLVHFLEKFYKNGYEEKLVDSLNRYPTKYTVWMLNRIINGSQEDRKMYFLKVLDNVIAFPNLNNEVVSIANHFRSLHQMLE